MTSARTALTETLKIRLPANRYRIIAAASMPDDVARPTIVVWQDNVRRHDQIGHDRLMVDLSLMLLVGHNDAEKAEAALEDGLTDLVQALHTVDWLHWTEAERLTYGLPDGPSYHAYRVTLTSLAKIGD